MESGNSKPLEDYGRPWTEHGDVGMGFVTFGPFVNFAAIVKAGREAPPTAGFKGLPLC